MPVPIAVPKRLRSKPPFFKPPDFQAAKPVAIVPTEAASVGVKIPA